MKDSITQGKQVYFQEKGRKTNFEVSYMEKNGYKLTSNIVQTVYSISHKISLIDPFTTKQAISSPNHSCPRYRTGPDRIKQPNPVSGTGPEWTFVRSGILSKLGHFIRSGPVRYRRIPDKTTSGTAKFHYGFLVLTIRRGYFGTFL